VRSANVTVVAKTSAADAERAAATFSRAWDRTVKLLDQWTPVTKSRGFGTGAALVLIDDQDPRNNRRQGPDEAYQQYGDTSVFYLRANDGAGPIADRMSVVEAAAVQAAIHEAEADAKIPAWMQASLTSWVSQSAVAESSSQEGPAVASPLTTTRWRSTPRQPRNFYPYESNVSDPAWAQFLLEGADGRHAGAFHEAMRATLESPDGQSDRPTPIDTLRRTLSEEFSQWRRDPAPFGYEMVASRYSSPEMSEVQNDLYILIKLAHRLESGRGVQRRERVQAGVRIIEFTDGRPTVDDREQADAAEPQRALRIDDIAQRLKNPAAQPWTMRDAGGSLWTERGASGLIERLEIGGGRVAIARGDENQLLLTYRWNQDHQLDATLTPSSGEGQPNTVRFSLRRVAVEEPKVHSFEATESKGE
jgi:hypothetical protein